MSVVTRNVTICDHENSFFVKNVTKCVTTKTKNIAGCDHDSLLKKRCPNGASLFVYKLFTLIWHFFLQIRYDRSL